jgi:hypothetical protein
MNLVQKILTPIDLHLNSPECLVEYSPTSGFGCALQSRVRKSENKLVFLTKFEILM